MVRLGWAALDAAAQLSVPAVAFCHSNLDQLARSALGGAAAMRADHARIEVAALAGRAALDQKIPLIKLSTVVQLRADIAGRRV